MWIFYMQQVLRKVKRGLISNSDGTEVAYEKYMENGELQMGKLEMAPSPMKDSKLELQDALE